MRFRKYTHRVRSLQHWFEFEPIEPAIFLRLAQQIANADNGYLFPVLKNLRVSFPLPLETLPLLLPSIRSLEFHQDQTSLSQTQQALAVHLHHSILRAKHLQELRLDLPFLVPATFAALRESVHLRSINLNVSGVTSGLLQQFAEIDGLINFKLSTSLNDKRTVSFHGFAHLQHLVIFHPRIQEVSRFVSMISSSLLRSLQVTTFNLENDTSLLVGCLTACAQHNLLRKLCFGVGGNPSDRSVAPLRLEVVISPLLVLRHLLDVSITCRDLTLEWSDDDVRVIATAWPGLEQLTLNHATCESGSRPSLLALTHFSRHCPRLTALHVSSMGTTMSEVDKNSMDALPKHHALCKFAAGDYEQLTVQPRTEHAETDVDLRHSAESLDRLFPNLDGMMDEWEVDDRWKELLGLTKQIRNARWHSGGS